MENPHQQSIRHQFHRDLQKVKYSALNKQKLISMTYSWEIGFNTRKKGRLKNEKCIPADVNDKTYNTYQIKTVDYRRETEGCQNLFNLSQNHSIQFKNYIRHNFNVPLDHLFLNADTI